MTLPADAREATEDARWRRWLARGDRQERRRHRIQVVAAVVMFSALGLRLLAQFLAG